MALMGPPDQTFTIHTDLSLMFFIHSQETERIQCNPLTFHLFWKMEPN